MKTPNRFILSLLVLVLSSLACQAVMPTSEKAPTPLPSPVVSVPVVQEGQPFHILGSFTVTNDFALKNYFTEHVVMLTDMHGFVIRDDEWELPVASQVLGDVDLRDDFLGGAFDLSLPLQPLGEFNDVDNNGQPDKGVQVFAIAYSPNMYGEPFSEGDDRSRGWPGYLATVKTDPENKDEVIGGQLIIWSPNESQQFPTGFGADGLLFTADDPAGPVPAGYSIIDLDASPFTVSQTPEPQLALYEPPDVAKKDYSNLPMAEAFDKMFEKVRKEYAFTGIEGKSPDWDKVYAELKPRVEKAQASNDTQAYYEAIRDFTYTFKDGHVSLDGDPAIQDFRDNYIGGYGFTIRELSDGRVIVNNLVKPGSAAEAGMQIGAEVTDFNGQPIGQAIGEAQPVYLQSSDFGIRRAQAIWLLRTSSGNKASVTFTNPGGSSQTATLTAAWEIDSLIKELGQDSVPAILPVESNITERNGLKIGYIRILSNSDDLNLTIKLFERALMKFQENEVHGIVIDMRNNSGGAPLGLAGFLTDKAITLGQLEYYSDKTGQFEPEGDPDEIWANENQYRFQKVVLLVGLDCYSACEIESYGFSQVPDAIVVGQTPTAGVEAETARGHFNLPGGLELVIPTGRFINPDGSIFLEGQGVKPTILVTIDAASVLGTSDTALEAAIKAAMGQ